ncbi:MAG TPA: sigma-70 family RNA polymerase sigma factor, partial [Candidatus Saccharimonadales bacterium]|nr:sigma-70 family RNA polymerase sigma factor [Candidatus Saccharimonadales bacterium]
MKIPCYLSGRQAVSIVQTVEATDMELLREYARNNAEPAFRALVERHLNMVHAVALRETAHPHLAEDVTQAVFIVLAQKAASIPSSTILTGWLFRATRFAAANVNRAEARREHWEQKAMESIMPPDSEPEQITPLLNEALGELPERDRAAILLRFFESKSMEEVGRSLGTTESAAKMRLSRATEKLRQIFRKRGMVVPASVLMAVLTAQAAQAAPAGLTTTIAATAFLKQTTATTLPIVKGTLLFMAQTKSKTLVISALVLLFAGTAVVVVQQTLAQKPQSAAAESKPTTAPVTSAQATNVLVFRDKPSWNRNPDFEETAAAMNIESEAKPSLEMGSTDLSKYRFIVIPGSQTEDFYQRYAAHAQQFDRYVTNGGTLVLELNGAEGHPFLLPHGVNMVNHGSKENTIVLPTHPIVSVMGNRSIRASFASHGYLAGV